MVGLANSINVFRLTNREGVFFITLNLESLLSPSYYMSMADMPQEGGKGNEREDRKKGKERRMQRMGESIVLRKGEVRDKRQNVEELNSVFLWKMMDTTETNK